MNREQPISLRNRHATHLFGSDGFENLDFVLNKAAEISIRVFCLVSLAAFFGTLCLNLLYLPGLSFRDTHRV